MTWEIIGSIEKELNVIVEGFTVQPRGVSEIIIDYDYVFKGGYFNDTLHFNLYDENHLDLIALELQLKNQIKRKIREKTTDSIVCSVIDKFQERSATGIKKYGTTLDRNDLSMDEWLNHLQEELMDAVLYIEKTRNERRTET